ncbi:unnamed protein product [Sphagnum troendelagicum]|uniref:Uncharacterized protein n=1 Tax=Sphagnum troendelagicum TaxID=128251 RepID=A0ABP0TPL8_9BRYO
MEHSGNQGKMRSLLIKENNISEYFIRNTSCNGGATAQKHFGACKQSCNAVIKRAGNYTKFTPKNHEIPSRESH